MEKPDKPKARDLNNVIRYTMWSVFRVAGPAAQPGIDPGGFERLDRANHDRIRVHLVIKPGQRSAFIPGRALR